MASPPLVHLQEKGTPVTPPPPRLRLLLGSGGGSSSSSDEALWKRLKEAGFDEEMIKRRDKAALIAYISKLETELYDYQHHMGLLILERKELTSKYEQSKANADLAEVNYKRNQAAYLSAIAEAKKREEGLKKALGIEKECTANLEKALREMRAETAETKVSAESKLAEARNMIEEAQKQLGEARSKMHTAESLHAEASRYDRSASRKLQDVEAREDELRRRAILSKSEWEAKEKDLNIEKQSINETQKILRQEQEKIMERQSFLNQREEYIFGRSLELDNLEAKLETAKANINKELLAVELEKSNLALESSALATREEVIAKREAQLNNKEQELLILQETVASKEYDEIQRLKAEHETTMQKRISEFEAGLAEQRKLFEEDMEAKRLTYKIREADLSQREKEIQEREHVLKLQSNALTEKEEDVTQKLHNLGEKEDRLSIAEKAAEKEMLELQNEREEIKRMKLELEEVKNSLEDERKQVAHANEKLEITVTERNELLILETKLKEEIDSLRAQKMEIITEADKLRAEKEKFECEWELIDEKKAELQKEAERIAEEKNSVCQYLKNEHDSLKIEKEILRNQFKNDFESLSREREEFMSKMEQEHSEWFSKIQHERDAFVEDIKEQKRELQINIEKRRQEVESYLREKEEMFEKEKAQELQKICFQKEMIAKELEHVELEKERLYNERIEVAQDGELRDKEWLDIKRSIDELNIQREKLKKQRELLHADREEIHTKIQHLKELESLNIALENKILSESHIRGLNVSQFKTPARKYLIRQQTNVNTDLDLNKSKIAVEGSILEEELPNNSSAIASPPSLTFSWLRKCADIIFKRSPEKLSDTSSGKNVEGKVLILHEAPNSKDIYSAKGRDVTAKLEKHQSAGTASEVAVPNSQEQKGNNDDIISENFGLKETKIDDDSVCESVEKERNVVVTNSTEKRSFVRKRLNDDSSLLDDSEMRLESTQKCQKKRRQDDVAKENTGEETNSELVGSREALDLEGVNGSTPLEKKLEDGVVSLGYMNKEHDDPKASEELGCVTEQAEVPQVDRVPSLSNNFLGRKVLGDGAVSSDCPELSEAEGVLDKSQSMSEEKLLESSAGLINCNIRKFSELVGFDQDRNDEVVDVDGKEISTKGEFWNFIIT